MSDDTLHHIRRQKLSALRQQGDAYPNDFQPQNKAALLEQAHDNKTRETLAIEKNTASVAGRLMLHRRMGKASFITLQDGTGQIQIYINEKIVGAKTFAEVSLWDIGDIIGCVGEIFKTKTNELSLRAETVRILVKCLRPLPDKYHGLTDVDARYRHRYLSLMVDNEERKRFVIRSQVIQFIRQYFHNLNYLEVETPILQAIPGGAAARPFSSYCNALSTHFYLRIAQELYLKRLIVGGFERVFEVNKNFRNEGVSTRHNPEFTMLEFNAAYQTGEDFINLVEDLLHQLVLTLYGQETLSYQGTVLSFKRPFLRLSPTEAILKQHPDWQNLDDRAFLMEKLSTFEGEKVFEAEQLPIEALQLLLFEKAAEESLIQPTFLVNYPAYNSPLAKRQPHDPKRADRFELFIAGRELVNGFSEQNDPDVQAEVFQQQSAQKEKGDDEAMHYDYDYIHALEYGLPPNAGGGIGIDRLVMLLTDQASIRDVILFPQLRPLSTEHE